jgi:hypothetical protein
MLLIGLFEQPEGLVLVTETRINLCYLVEIDISVRRQIVPPENLDVSERMGIILL